MPYLADGRNDDAVQCVCPMCPRIFLNKEDMRLHIFETRCGITLEQTRQDYLRKNPTRIDMSRVGRLPSLPHAIQGGQGSSLNPSGGPGMPGRPGLPAQPPPKSTAGPSAKRKHSPSKSPGSSGGTPRGAPMLATGTAIAPRPAQIAPPSFRTVTQEPPRLPAAEAQRLLPLNQPSAAVRGQPYLGGQPILPPGHQAFNLPPMPESGRRRDSQGSAVFSTPGQTVSQLGPPMRSRPSTEDLDRISRENKRLNDEAMERADRVISARARAAQSQGHLPAVPAQVPSIGAQRSSAAAMDYMRQQATPSDRRNFRREDSSEKYMDPRDIGSSSGAPALLQHPARSSSGASRDGARRQS